jgi:hypothetical protein
MLQFWLFSSPFLHLGLHHGWRKFWNLVSWNAPVWLLSSHFRHIHDFTIVEGNFEIWSLETLQFGYFYHISITFTNSPWLIFFNLLSWKTPVGLFLSPFPHIQNFTMVEGNFENRSSHTLQFGYFYHISLIFTTSAELKRIFKFYGLKCYSSAIFITFSSFRASPWLKEICKFGLLKRSSLATFVTFPSHSRLHHGWRKFWDLVSWDAPVWLLSSHFHCIHDFTIVEENFEIWSSEMLQFGLFIVFSLANSPFFPIWKRTFQCSSFLMAKPSLYRVSLVVVVYRLSSVVRVPCVQDDTKVLSASRNITCVFCASIILHCTHNIFRRLLHARFQH